MFEVLHVIKARKLMNRTGFETKKILKHVAFQY
jgi:hypothetical protein